ncbi:MAG: type III secretion inner membrane ring lipoprotein SctJ [Candidatus Rhabdochlamydia sp.]
MRKALLWILPVMLLLTGCESHRVIVNNLEEREANEIVVFLASQKINAEKVAAKSTGGIGGDSAASLWNISVGEKNMTFAMSILNQNGLPRKKGTNLLELFAKQGLMTSEKEETIRYQAGLEQQIAHTIRKIDGVIDADVQLSFPQEIASMTPTTSIKRTTAAVYVKHQGIIDDPNSHLISKIKRLVSGSINGLDINDVTIISDRSRFTDISLMTPAEEATVSQDFTTIWSIILSQHSVLRFRLLFLALIVSNFFFVFLAGWMAWKFYPLLSRQGGITSLFSQQQISIPEETVSLE